MAAPNIPFELLGGPFTTAQARALGVSESMLRGPAWRQLTRGVWINAELPDSRERRLDAARLLMTPNAFVCGPTAAWIWGVDVLGLGSKLIWIGCQPGKRIRQRDGTVVRQVAVPASDLIRRRGVWMTSAVRTCFDCARWLSRDDAVVVLDALAHDGLLTVEQLARYLEGHPPVAHIRKVDEIIRLADPRSQSPQETRTRLVLIDAGFEPVPQFKVKAGDFNYYLDLALPALKLAVEYDGSLHWAQRRADDRRRDRIRKLGWTIIVVSAQDIATPAAKAQLVDQIRAECDEAGVGLPF